MYYGNIPRAEDCEEIVAENPTVFAKNVQQLDGFCVCSYNYRVPSYKAFMNPLAGSPEVSGMELRGLTFVTDIHTQEVSRFLMLPKFFNFGEVPETFPDNVMQKEIDNVTVKRDGSLIRFMRLPDGSVAAKTQKWLRNEQSLCAEKIRDQNRGLRKFIDWSLEEEIALMFELTAPDNQVVLPYPDTRLTLVKAREERTGIFIPLSQLESLISEHDVDVVEEINVSGIDDLIAMAKERRMFEGWVVQFADQHLMKLKTSWYAGVHELCTSKIHENKVIELSIAGKIDDVISSLLMLGRNDVIEEIMPIHSKVCDYFSCEFERISGILSGFDGDKKAFALQNMGDPLFGIIMSSCTRPDKLEENIKKQILKTTRSRQEAVDWLGQIGG